MKGLIWDITALVGAVMIVAGLAWHSVSLAVAAAGVGVCGIGIFGAWRSARVKPPKGE